MVAVAVAACGVGSSSPSTGSKAPYALTISTDLSGPFSGNFGIGFSEGFQAYIAHLNETGGVSGHKVLLTTLDDRSDVQAGLANYQQAVNSNSLGIFLDASSAVSGPVGVKATQDHLVYIPASYQGGVGVYQYVYGATATLDAYLPVLTAFAASKVSNVSGAKVALIQYDTPTERTYQPTMVSTFKAKGWDVNYQQFVPGSSVDFSVAAGQIATAAPAFILASLLDTQLPQFTTAVRARGVNAPIVTFATNPTDAVVQKINDSNFFVARFAASPKDTSVAAVVEMRRIASETGHNQGLDSNIFTLGYVTARVVATALGKCPSDCTRETFNTALETTTVDPQGLMAGKPGYSKTSHVLPQGVALTQVNSSGIGVPIAGYGFSK